MVGRRAGLRAGGRQAAGRPAGRPVGKQSANLVEAATTLVETGQSLVQSVQHMISWTPPQKGSAPSRIALADTLPLLLVKARSVWVEDAPASVEPVDHVAVSQRSDRQRQSLAFERTWSARSSHDKVRRHTYHFGRWPQTPLLPCTHLAHLPSHIEQHHRKGTSFSSSVVDIRILAKSHLRVIWHPYLLPPSHPPHPPSSDGQHGRGNAGGFRVATPNTNWRRRPDS